jgi:hypothetical protein
LSTPAVFGTVLKMALIFEHQIFGSVYLADALHTRIPALVTVDRHNVRKAKPARSMFGVGDIDTHRSL